MKKIRVLHILHGMETFGGVESFLIQYYKNINRDEIIFDFMLCCNNTLKNYQDDVLFKDSKVIELNAIKTSNNSIIDYAKMVYKINCYLENNDYDIVHVNTSNLVFQFFVANFMMKKFITISHSHSSTPVIKLNGIKVFIKEYLKRIATPVFQFFIRNKFDYLLACSRKAGISLFGIKGIDLKKFHIVFNAIDTDLYKYNQNSRLRIREDKGVLEKDIVYGYVGRLVESKNLLFLIDIFNELHRKNPNSVLFLVGDGPMKDKIYDISCEYNISDSVYMFGEKENIADYLSAMDLFIFPTLYEGLGIVAIESQCNGLPIVASDVVPIEARITDIFYEKSLSCDANQWAHYIETISIEDNRNGMSHEVAMSGYDIKVAAKNLLNFYKRIIGV